MFDKYIVCEDGFRRLDDGRTGARIEVRMPYYRGLGLSMVEAVAVAHKGRLTIDEGPGEFDGFGPGLRTALVLPAI